MDWDETEGFPDTLQINAWSEVGNSGAVDPDLRRRLLRLDKVARDRDLPQPPADPRDWRDPRIGWGIVLPENAALDKADRWRAVDAPQPIRDLVAARGAAPVLRASPDWPPGTIRRYRPDGSHGDLSVAGSEHGTGADRIPRYLLIVGSPAAIPWRVQYDLQVRHCVGRLDLDDDGCANYVDALLGGWAERTPTPGQTLVWSVDKGGNDITALMATMVGQPIHEHFRADADPGLSNGARRITGGAATGTNLRDALAQHRPGLIVTTSHGQTGPLNDTAAMRASLGLLVDDDFALLDPGTLSGDSAPSGAIWFAQACCSAGSAAQSSYRGILETGSNAERILRAVAACGDTVAPMPRQLLGAANPLRGFVGHVEPTFNWSMRHRQTRQPLSQAFVDCFYQRLFLGDPIGLALESVRSAGASFLTSMDLAERALIETGDPVLQGTILAAQLTARDWQSIVLLGDPTATLVSL